VASSQEKSTTVRTKNAVKISPQERYAPLIRPLFGVLERVAPPVGARLAWKLWTTPSEPSATAVARSREGGMGEVRTIRVELPDWTGRRPSRRDGSPKPPLTAALTVELLGPADGPIVYLLHGWGGWRGQFAPIGRELAARGFRVVLVDAPNHGDSGPGTLGPKTTLLPDFSRALEAVICAIGPAYAVIGHSLGAATSALALLEGVQADKAVFIAPPSDPIAFTRALAGILGFGERIRTRMVRIGERRTGIELAEPGPSGAAGPAATVRQRGRWRTTGRTRAARRGRQGDTGRRRPAAGRDLAGRADRRDLAARAQPDPARRGGDRGRGRVPQAGYGCARCRSAPRCQRSDRGGLSRTASRECSDALRRPRVIN
jgi:pimeloyl-ACP methyl ester carboxylesterase